MRNYHARFLGGTGAEMPLTYPVSRGTGMNGHENIATHDADSENMAERTDQYHRRERRRSVVWHMVGLSTAGLLIGAMAGLSATPVVGTMLPLLFGLLGGVSGFYAAKIDLDNSLGRHRLSFMGKSLAIFALTAWLGAFYGISVRTGVSPSHFFMLPVAPLGTNADEGLFTTGEPIQISTALELSALRYRLERLGVPESDMYLIVQAARKEVSEPPSRQEIMHILDTIRTKALQARERFTQGIMEGLEGREENAGGELPNRGRVLWDHYEYLHEVAERNDESVTVRDWASRFREDAKAFSRHLHDFGFGSGPPQILLDHEELRGALWDLELALLEASYRLSGSDWISGERIADAVDELIRAQSEKSGHEPEDVSGRDALRPHFAH